MFRVFRPGSVTRAEAVEYTNESVIDRLSPAEKKGASEVLDRFCRAFNAIIILPGNLHECADNVFVKDDPRQGRIVDLSGGSGSGQPVGMRRRSPLIFSLPNTLKDGDGNFLNPSCLCTVFVLQRLRVSCIARFVFGSIRFVNSSFLPIQAGMMLTTSLCCVWSYSRFLFQ